MREVRNGKNGGIDTTDGGGIMILELLPTQTVAFIAAFPQGIGSEVLFRPNLNAYFAGANDISKILFVLFICIKTSVNRS